MADNPMSEFRRDISFNVSSLENGRIKLCGTMRDVYHDIVLEVLVNGDTLVIEGAQVEFRKSPEDECINAAGRLQLLVGAVIGRGLNKRILEAVGGEEGCGNLRTILTGLLPLAMNVKAARGFSDENAMMESIRQKLRGTCAGYPASGPGVNVITDKETFTA